MNLTHPSQGHKEISGLYQNHHYWLVDWIHRHVSEKGDAEDLAQSTFLRLLNRPEIPTISKPRAFLKTVAGGLVSNFYRRKDLEKAYLEALAAQPELVSPSPEQVHQTLETLVQVSLLLEGLPEKVKKAFLMAQLDGMKYNEIAEQLCVSVSSVKKYMFKATRHCLQIQLDEGQV